MTRDEAGNASAQDHPEPQVTLDVEPVLAVGRLLMSVLTEEELEELRTQLIDQKS
jgi:hypothetical protein